MDQLGACRSNYIIRLLQRNFESWSNSLFQYQLRLSNLSGGRFCITSLNKLVVKYDIVKITKLLKKKELSVTNICDNMIGKK